MSNRLLHLFMQWEKKGREINLQSRQHQTVQTQVLSTKREAAWIDPNAPPYQPPPPFTAPMEGKGSRPKNMTPYRSPPPYVPP